MELRVINTRYHDIHNSTHTYDISGMHSRWAHRYQHPIVDSNLLYLNTLQGSNRLFNTRAVKWRRMWTIGQAEVVNYSQDTNSILELGAQRVYNSTGGIARDIFPDGEGIGLCLTAVFSRLSVLGVLPVR
jgi:hypothetical protein